VPGIDFREQIRQGLDSYKVGIVEFAEEYCQKPLYPRQRVLLKLIFLEEMDEYEEGVLDSWIAGEGGVEISPGIRERRQWLRDHGYKHFPEVGFVGGRRSSKGYVTGIAITRILHDTWKLGDPGRYYGVDPDKEIYFSCVASSLDQAKKFQFADVVNTATKCKPLIESKHGLGKVQEESLSVHTLGDSSYIAELKRQGIPVGRNFAKIRVTPLAANADTIRGSATMAIVFDEMAFMETTEGNRSSADECYSAAEPSLAQFGKDGIIFLNSSPYTKLGKFFDRYSDSQMMEADGSPSFPTLMFFKFPSWELYRDYEMEGDKFKWALMVSPDIDPETIENPIDKDLCLRAKLSEKANPDKFKVERRAEWSEVVNAYLNPERVNEAYAPSYRGKEIQGTQMGNYNNMPYVMHCDPSSTTAGFGFAIAHVEEFMDPDTQLMEGHVVFDLVKRWNPADFPNSTIDYMQVMEELLRYCEAYRPRSLTFDQFNSVAPIQWLQKNLAEKGLSVQVYMETATKLRNRNKWEFFKTALNLGRVHIPPDCVDSEYSSLELKFLQEKQGSVDKQSIGPVQTKDIADCIAECTRVLMGGIMGFGMNPEFGSPSFGSQGGFQIGGLAANQNDHPLTDSIRAGRSRIDAPASRSMDYRMRRGRN
jgi:hypothetical protein